MTVELGTVTRGNVVTTHVVGKLIGLRPWTLPRAQVAGATSSGVGRSGCGAGKASPVEIVKSSNRSAPPRRRGSSEGHIGSAKRPKVADQFERSKNLFERNCSPTALDDAASRTWRRSRRPTLESTGVQNDAASRSSDPCTHTPVTSTWDGYVAR